MRSQLAALADGAAIDISRLLGQADGQLEFPKTRTASLVHNATPGAICYVEIPDIVGMLALLNREALTAFLDKQIAAKSNDRIALTFEQRQTQSSQIMNELFEAELNEATLTLQAWEGGLPIEANPGIGPASWLAVHNVVAPPVDTSTTPGHGYDIVGPRR